MSQPTRTFLSWFSPLLAVLLAMPVFADSQARIVRLSDVQGDVQVDRHGGQGFEKAFLNLPLTEGMKIKTGTDARTELEFEDGSTLRLAPGSAIDISQLSLRATGGKVTAIDLQTGTAYVNFLGAKDDQLSLSFSRETFTLARAAHLRIEVAEATATLAMLKGEVEVVGPSGKVKVERNQTANFNLAEGDRYELAKSVDEAPYDSWDQEQSKYRDRYQSKSYSSYSPYGYGTADLQYYGSFFSAPGYGMLWQPYFAGAGWDPFMNGAWAFWPGFGYGWVSSYPWGWTPYHYGSWVYLPPYGWVWQPGGAWMGWNTLPVIANAPPNFIGPRSPALPGHRIVPVNRGPAPVQVGKGGTRLQIPANSGGLGIQRGGFKNLGALSQDAVRHGSVVVKAPAAQTSVARRDGSDSQSLGRTSSPRGYSTGSMAPRANSAGRVGSMGRAGSGSAGRGGGGRVSGVRR